MENEKDLFREAKEQLLEEVGSYANAEYEYSRLRVVDYVSRLAGTVLLAVGLILIAFAVLSFCAAAAVFALAMYMPAWAACLIVAACYILLIPVLVICSKTLFRNLVIRRMSGLKNREALRLETIRAEGNAALRRERLNGRLLIVQALYSRLAQWGTTIKDLFRGLFRKK